MNPSRLALDDIECERCGFLIEIDSTIYSTPEGTYHEGCWNDEPDIDKDEEEREQTDLG